MMGCKGSRGRLFQKDQVTFLNQLHIKFQKSFIENRPFLPDEAVVTGHTVIPLPKLPSSFDEVVSPDYDVSPTPTYRPPTPILPKPSPVEPVQRSPMSTLDRYRNRSRPTRIQTSTDEEKFVLDRAQPEKLNKQVCMQNGIQSPTVSCRVVALCSLLRF